MKKDLVGWLDGGLARVVGSGADCLCLSFLPLLGRSQLDCVMVLLRGCGKVIGSGSGVECFEGGVEGSCTSPSWGTLSVRGSRKVRKSCLAPPSDGNVTELPLLWTLQAMMSSSSSVETVNRKGLEAMTPSASPPSPSSQVWCVPRHEWRYNCRTVEFRPPDASEAWTEPAANP